MKKLIQMKENLMGKTFLIIITVSILLFSCSMELAGKSAENSNKENENGNSASIISKNNDNNLLTTSDSVFAAQYSYGGGNFNQIIDPKMGKITVFYDGKVVYTIYYSNGVKVSEHIYDGNKLNNPRLKARG
jgi:hypothetical protein